MTGSLDATAQSPVRKRRLFPAITTIESITGISLRVPLLVISGFSLLAGLAQSGLLLILSTAGIQSLRGSEHFKVAGFHFGTGEAIWGALTLLVLMSLGGLAAALFASRLAQRAIVEVRQNIVSGFFNATWDVQSKERLGNLQQLLSYNAEQVAGVILSLAIMVQASFMLVALLVAAVLVNPVEALISGAALAALASALRPLTQKGRGLNRSLSQHNRSFATQVTEFTRLAVEFRIFGVKEAAVSRLQAANSEAGGRYFRARFIQVVTPVIYQSLALLFVVVGFSIVVGSHSRNLGGQVALLLLMLRSLLYGSTLQSTLQAVQASTGFTEVLLEAISEFHESVPAVKDVPAPSAFDVSFTNVSYRYDGRQDVLRDISFDVPSGKAVAIVGPSGSGKTTLSRLLLGLIEPTTGSLMVGGVTPSELVSSPATQTFAYVSQEPILMQGSIADNIAFFRPLDFTTVESASKQAFLHEDIAMMNGGYDTIVGEGGSELSGGQRQRLSIARALAGSSNILVMDEPTSAVDNRSESLIRQTLRNLNGQRTCFIISHRLSLVEDCEYVLVLSNDGRYEFGRREEVVAGAFYLSVSSSISDSLDG